MTRRQLIWVHVCYWLYVFVLLEIMNKLAYQHKFMDWSELIKPNALSNYLIFGIVFYGNYLVVLPKLLDKRLYFFTVSSWIGLLSFFIVCRYWVQEVLLLRYFGTCNYCNENLRIYIVNNFFQGFSSLILSSTVIWFIHQWLQGRRRQYELIQQKNAAEKAFLQLQASPHFLFNTLNNIYSMVFHGSKQSLPAIQYLADIMRYAVNEAQHEYVALRTELSYLNNYIELQKLRVEYPAIVYEQTGETEDKTIAPMLLISFIENAFKHGIFNDPDQPLLIRINIHSDILLLKVVNKVNERSVDTASGIGLENVRNRLRLYYPDSHDLTIEKKEQHFISVLRINFRA